MLKVKITLRSDSHDFMSTFMSMITPAPLNCSVNDAVLVVACSLNNFLLSVTEFPCSIYCIRKLNEHTFSLKHLSRNNQYLSLSFEILLQESEIAELAKNSGDSSQKMVYLNEQLREKDR